MTWRNRSANTFNALAAPAIWAVHFIFVYSAESIFCSKGIGASAYGVVFAAASGASLVAIMLVAQINWINATRNRKSDPPTERYFGWIGLGLSILSMIALLWMIIPAMMLSACMPAI
jgi:hypothetical protein